MLSLPCFSRKSQVKPSASTVRADGYSAQAARIACLFQRYVEREPDCDYPALASALGWARTTDYPVTLYTLRAKYNDSRYSSAQFATRTR